MTNSTSNKDINYVHIDEDSYHFTEIRQIIEFIKHNDSKEDLKKRLEKTLLNGYDIQKLYKW